MIIKASQRGGGRDLAAHLMRTDENEHLSIHAMRGFASDNLRDAFREAEAVSRATKCKQYLFSVSFSPPEDTRVPVGVFEDAIDRAEERLGLQGQPRVVVFHEKEGRRHAHCVWSRIDADTMTARPMPFFKTKLMALSRALYLEQGWRLPRGLETASERDPANFTLAEWQQAKRQGIDPRWIKQTVQACWRTADNRNAFARALEERGFALAKGDRRGFVVVDFTGEVYALTRLVDAKTKDIKARLGTPDGLKDVGDVRQDIGARMRPAIRRHIAESRQRFQKRSALLGAAKAEMTQTHRAARSDLVERQRREWDAENKARAARLPKGLIGLWHRLTGIYQDVRRANESEARDTQARQENARQAQIDAQRDERARLQTEFKDLRREQAEELLSLRADIGRYLRFSRGQDAPAHRHDAGLSLGRIE